MRRRPALTLKLSHLEVEALAHVTSEHHGSLWGCPPNARALCRYKGTLDRLHRRIMDGEGEP